MTKVMKKIQHQRIQFCIMKMFFLSYPACGIKGRNISILIMLWLVGCYAWYITLGKMYFKMHKISIIFRWTMLSKLCLLDQLKKSYMELLIRYGSNILYSIIRMIPLTAIILSVTLKILLMVTVIYGIRNTHYHPPKFLVL